MLPGGGEHDHHHQASRAAVQRRPLPDFAHGEIEDRVGKLWAAGAQFGFGVGVPAAERAQNIESGRAPVSGARGWRRERQCRFSLPAQVGLHRAQDRFARVCARDDAEGREDGRPERLVHLHVVQLFWFKPTHVLSCGDRGLAGPIGRNQVEVVDDAAVVVGEVDCLQKVLFDSEGVDSQADEDPVHLFVGVFLLGGERAAGQLPGRIRITADKQQFTVARHDRPELDAVRTHVVLTACVLSTLIRRIFRAAGSSVSKTPSASSQIPAAAGISFAHSQTV